MANVKISELPTLTPVDGAEYAVVLDGSTTKSTLISTIASYVVNTTLAGSTDVDPATTDKIVGFDAADAAQIYDIDDLCDYAILRLYDAAGAQTSMQNGDLIHFERSNVSSYITYQNFLAAVQTSVEATAIDFSGLDAATIATASILMDNGGTNKYATWANVSDQMLTDFTTNVSSELSDVSTIDNTDMFWIYDGAAKYATATELYTYMVGEMATAASHANLTAEVDFLVLVSGALKQFQWADLAEFVADSCVNESLTITSLTAGDFITTATFNAGSAFTYDAKKITRENFIADIQSDVLDYTGLTSDTAVSSGDVLLMNDGATKQITMDNFETQIWTDYTTWVNSEAPVCAGLAAADQLFVYDADAAAGKSITATLIASYVETAISANVCEDVWDNAAALTTTEGTDVFVYETAAGARKKITWANMISEITTDQGTDMQDAIWSGVDGSRNAGTLADADLFVVENSGNYYDVQAQYIADYTIDKMMNKAAITPADGDTLAAWDDGTTDATMTIDTLAKYVQQTLLDDWDTDSIASGDFIYFQDIDEAGGGVADKGKKITAANLAAYVLTGAQAASLSTTGLSADTPAAGDYFIFDDGAAKKIALENLETQIWTDFNLYLQGLSAIAPIVTLADADQFYVLDNGSTSSNVTAAVMATYMETELTAAATAANSSTLDAGDRIVFTDDGTSLSSITWSFFVSEIAADAQASVLDLSALGTTVTSVATGAYVLVCESGTAKKITYENFMTDVLTDNFNTYVRALDPVGTVAGTDRLYLSQDAATEKYITVTDLATEVSELIGGYPWTLLSDYTAQPSSTSQILFSDTTGLEIGMPLKYTYSGTTYYGIITNVTTNTSIDIAGAALVPGGAADIDYLYYAPTSHAITKEIFIDTAHGALVDTDILSTIVKRYVRWEGGNAYLVSFAATEGVADSGSEPKINVKIDGNLVGTDDTNLGIQLNATAGTWSATTAVGINTSNYDIVRGDAIEIRCTAAGGTGDAECLSVQLVFVYE